MFFAREKCDGSTARLLARPVLPNSRLRWEGRFRRAAVQTRSSFRHVEALAHPAPLDDPVAILKDEPMLSRQDRGYTTAVELDDWRLYFELKDFTAQFREAKTPNGNPLSQITKNGVVYWSDDISEALGQLDAYVAEAGIDSKKYQEERDRQQKPVNGEMDPFEDFSSMGNYWRDMNRAHHPSMEFKLWEQVLPFIGAFQPDEDDPGPYEDDWSPPDNFENGTADEREVWDDFHQP